MEDHFSDWSMEEAASWLHWNKQPSSMDPFLPPSRATGLVPRPVCDETVPWLMPVEVVMEERGTSSSASATASASVTKSHSQAEKRRRDRINAQLATLRKLIPKSDKMDKAALLGSVINHVKDLRRRALEISRSGLLIPSEVDEVTIDCDVVIPNQHASTSSKPDRDRNKDRAPGEVVFVRVSLCCDDRPELLPELIRVLKGLKLTTVKADVASVGGRIKSVLILCSDDEDEGVCVNTLKQSLKVVMSRIACSSMALSSCRVRSKRQRFFLPYQNPLP